MPGRASGSTTASSVRAGPRPSERDASSTRGFDEVEGAARRRERLRQEAHDIGEDQQREALVEHASVTGAEEDERERDDDAGNGVRHVREALQQVRPGRRVAPGEHGDGKGGERCDDGRRARRQRRVECGTPGEPEGSRPRCAHQPSTPSGSTRKTATHGRAERESRPAPAAERAPPAPACRRRVRSGRSRRAAAALPSSATHDRRQRDQHQREDRGRVPVEQRLVLEIDRARQRRVLHQRDGAEVGEDVERDEQRARRRAHGRRAGSVTREEDAERRAAERARGLLERDVDRAERRRGEQEDVRVGRQRQRERGRRRSRRCRAAVRLRAVRAPAAAARAVRARRAGTSAAT